MAQSIGSLYADITVNSGSYVAGMAQVDRATERTANTITRKMGVAQASIDRFSKSTSSSGGIRPYGLIAVSRAFERLNDRVSLLRGTLLATTAVFGGFTAAISSNLILRYADSYNNLSNQIRVVSKDSTDLAGQIAAVSAAASNSRSGLQATATLYSRLAKAAPTRTGQEILQYVQTIQKALALGGATAQEAQSAAVQFSQAVASNRLGGEELRAVLETPLGLALAKGLDVTIGKLREMSIAGELTADKVLGALARVKGDIDKQFSKSTLTIDQSLVQADNALTEFVGHLDHTYGLTRIVSGGILAFAHNLDLIAIGIGGIGAALGVAFAGRLVGKGVEGALNRTTRAVSTSMAKARKEVDEYTETQKKLQGQLAESTNSLEKLRAASDQDFANKGDVKAATAAAQRLEVQNQRRIETEKALAQARAAAGKIDTSVKASALKAAQALHDTETKLQQTEIKGLSIANQRAAAEAKVAAARKLNEDIAKGAASAIQLQARGLAGSQLELDLAKKIGNAQEQAGKKVDGVRSKIAASQEKSIKLTNDEANAQARLNAAVKERVDAKAAGLSAPNKAEEIAAEKALNKVRADGRKELDRRVKLEEQLKAAKGTRDETVQTAAQVAAEKQLAQAQKEHVKTAQEGAANQVQQSKLVNQISEQRTALVQKEGAAAAKAAEEATKLGAARVKAETDAEHATQGHAKATLDLDEANRRVIAGATANKSAKIGLEESVRGGLADDVSRVTKNLVLAKQATSGWTASIGALKSVGSSFVGFLGGPWGFGFTAATIALAVFGIQAQRTAEQLKNAQKNMEEDLGKIAAEGGAAGKSAEKNLALEQLDAQITTTQDTIEGYAASLQASRNQVTGTLQSFFDVGGPGGATGDALTKKVNDIADKLQAVGQDTLSDVSKLEKLGATVKAIPEISVLPENLQDEMVALTRNMSLFFSVISRAQGALSKLQATSKAGVGDLEAVQKIQQQGQAAADALAQMELGLKASEISAAALLDKMTAVAGQSDIAAKIEASAAKLRKDNPEIVDNDVLKQLATAGVLLDVNKNATDKWLNSSAAVEGEYGRLLGTLQQFAAQDSTGLSDEAKRLQGAVRDVVAQLTKQKVLTDDNRRQIAFQVDGQKELLALQLKKATVGEREGRILETQAALTKQVLDEFKTTKGFDLRGAAVELVRFNDKLEEVRQASEAIPRALAINADFATGLGQQIPILEALVQHSGDLTNSTLGLKNAQAALAQTINGGREQLFGQAQSTERVIVAYDGVSAQISDLSKQFIASGGSALVLQNGLDGIREKLIGIGADSSEVDNVVAAIERGVIATAKAAVAQENARKTGAELFAEQQKRAKLSEYEVRLQDAQAAGLGEVSAGVKLNSEQLAFINSVQADINSHSDDWLHSTEAQKGVFHDLLSLAERIAGVPLVKQGLDSNDVAKFQDAVTAQAELNAKTAQRLGLSQSELRILEQQDQLAKSLIGDNGTIINLKQDQLRADSELLVMSQRQLDLAEKASAAIGRAVDLSPNSGLARQATTLDSLAERSDDFAAASQQVTVKQNALAQAINVGGRALLGQKLEFAGVNDAYETAGQAIVSLQAKLAKGEATTGDIDNAVENFRKTLIKLGANSVATDQLTTGLRAVLAELTRAQAGLENLNKTAAELFGDKLADLNLGDFERAFRDVQAKGLAGAFKDAGEQAALVISVQEEIDRHADGWKHSVEATGTAFSNILALAEKFAGHPLFKTGFNSEEIARATDAVKQQELANRQATIRLGLSEQGNRLLDYEAQVREELTSQGNKSLAGLEGYIQAQARSLALSQERVDLEKRAAGAIQDALDADIGDIGMEQQINSIQAAAKQAYDFKAVTVGVTQAQDGLNNALAVGGQKLNFAGAAQDKLSQAYATIGGDVRQLSRDFIASGADSGVLQRGLDGVRDKLVAMGANVGAVDTVVEGIKNAILGIARAQESLNRSNPADAIRKSLELAGKSATELLLDQAKIAKSTGDTALQGKVAAAVLAEINSHQQNWLFSAEATKGTFAELLRIVQGFVPGLKLAKDALDPKDTAANYEDIVNAQKRALGVQINEARLSDGQARAAKIRLGLMEELAAKGADLTQVNRQQLESDVAIIAEQQRQVELQERISGAQQAGSEYATDALEKQSQKLREIQDRYYDLEAVTNGVANANVAFNGVLSEGIAKMANETGGIAGMRGELGAFSADIVSIKDRFIAGQLGAFGLHRELSAIKTEMEKVAGKHDWLDALINGIESAISAMGALIGLKRKLDDNPVDGTAGTTGRLSQVRTDSGNTIGVHRFGGDPESLSGPITKSINETQRVLSYGSASTVASVENASSTIATAVNDNGTKVSDGISGLREDVRGLGAAITAKDATDAGLGTAISGEGGSDGLGGSAGTDKLLGSDESTRQTIGSAAGLTTTAVTTTGSSIIAAVTAGANSVVAGIAAFNPAAGTDQLLNSDDATRATINTVVGQIIAAVTAAATAATSAISAAAAAVVSSVSTLDPSAGADRLLGSDEATRGVISSGADRTIASIEAANSAITGALNAASGVISGSVIASTNAISALDPSAGIDRLLGSDENTRGVISSGVDRLLGSVSAAVGSLIGAVSEAANSITAAVSVLDPGAGTDRLLGSDEATRQVINSATGLTTAAVNSAASTIIAAVTAGTNVLAAGIGALDPGAGTDRLVSSDDNTRGVISSGADRVVGSVDAASNTVTGAVNAASSSIVGAVLGAANAVSALDPAAGTDRLLASDDTTRGSIGVAADRTVGSVEGIGGTITAALNAGTNIVAAAIGALDPAAGTDNLLSSDEATRGVISTTSAAVAAAVGAANNAITTAVNAVASAVASLAASVAALDPGAGTDRLLSSDENTRSVFTAGVDRAVSSVESANSTITAAVNYASGAITGASNAGAAAIAASVAALDPAAGTDRLLGSDEITRQSFGAALGQTTAAITATGAEIITAANDNGLAIANGILALNPAAATESLLSSDETTRQAIIAASTQAVALITAAVTAGATAIVSGLAALDFNAAADRLITSDDSTRSVIVAGVDRTVGSVNGANDSITGAVNSANVSIVNAVNGIAGTIASALSSAVSSIKAAVSAAAASSAARSSSSSSSSGSSNTVSGGSGTDKLLGSDGATRQTISAGADQVSAAVKSGLLVGNALQKQGLGDVTASITQLGSSVGYGRFNGYTKTGGGSGGSGGSSYAGNDFDSFKAGDFSYSGNNNQGSTSWDGKQITIGGGGGGSSSGSSAYADFMADPKAAIAKAMFGAWAMPSSGGDTLDAANNNTSSTATDQPITVNISVKPILEGQRLSAQSRAEIKQAAAIGANQALRAYNGR